METKQYPLFMQTWFPSVGVMNKIGQIQDKKLLQWAYNQFLSWNQLVLPKESFHFQKAQEGNHCLLGWITIVQGKEDFGRSYKEIRAVLFDEKASLEDQQTLKEKLFSYPIQPDTPSQELMLEWSCLPQEPVIEIKQEDTLAEPVEKQEHTNVETMPVEEKKKTCHGLDKRSYAAIFFCMVFLFSVWGLTWKFISQNKTSVLNEKGKKINPYKNNNQFSTQFNNKEKRNSPLLKHRDPYFLNYFLKHIENWEKSLTKISVSPEKNLSKEKKEEPISLSKKYTIFFVYPEGALDILKWFVYPEGALDISKWQEEDILSKKEKKIYLCKGKYTLKAIRSKNCYWKKAQIIKPEGKKTEKIWEQEKTEQATQKSEITIASDTTIVFELEHRINSISVQPERWGEIEDQGKKSEEFQNIYFDYGKEIELKAISKNPDLYEFQSWQWEEKERKENPIKIGKNIDKITAYFHKNKEYEVWEQKYQKWINDIQIDNLSLDQIINLISNGNNIKKDAKDAYKFDKQKLSLLVDKKKKLEENQKLKTEIDSDFTSTIRIDTESLERFKKYRKIITKNIPITLTLVIDLDSNLILEEDLSKYSKKEDFSFNKKDKEISFDFSIDKLDYDIEIKEKNRKISISAKKIILEYQDSQKNSKIIECTVKLFKFKVNLTSQEIKEYKSKIYQSLERN